MDNNAHNEMTHLRRLVTMHMSTMTSNVDRSHSANYVRDKLIKRRTSCKPGKSLDRIELEIADVEKRIADLAANTLDLIRETRSDTDSFIELVKNNQLMR